VCGRRERLLGPERWVRIGYLRPYLVPNETSARSWIRSLETCIYYSQPVNRSFLVFVHYETHAYGEPPLAMMSWPPTRLRWLLYEWRLNFSLPP